VTPGMTPGHFNRASKGLIACTGANCPLCASGDTPHRKAQEKIMKQRSLGPSRYFEQRKPITLCSYCAGGNHSFHDSSAHRLGCQQDGCDCPYEEACQHKSYTPLHGPFARCNKCRLKFRLMGK
jgi:hypothetical protein